MILSMQSNFSFIYQQNTLLLVAFHPPMLLNFNNVHNVLCFKTTTIPNEQMFVIYFGEFRAEIIQR